MNINEVKELIELINASDLAYFEYENGDSRIKMDKSLTRNTESISNKEFKTQTMSKETEVDKIIKEEVKREKEEVNEIVGTISEVSGKIVEVLVKDGDMVEYETPLFKIEEDV